MSIRIRPMTPEDHQQVFAIARVLASWFKPLDQMALVIDLPQHEGFVATEAEEVVGFVAYHLLGPQMAELSWFGVQAMKQGRGIGYHLLSALEKTLAWRGIHTLELSTVPADHDPVFAATNAFYKRYGFTIEQRDNDYYAYGRPRILLKKQMAKPVTSRIREIAEKSPHLSVKEIKSRQ